MASLQAKIILEDDANSDVEIVDKPEQANLDTGEPPLLYLMNSLIKNEHNTLITNAQILNILQNEYGILVDKCHKLEIDIFSTVIKTYIKDWPQWKEVERITTKLTKAQDNDALTKVINNQYKKLKEYLGVMIEATKQLAKDAVIVVNNAIAEKVKVPVQNIEEAGVSDATGEINLDNSEVVMEIQCTREELNHLIFRRPRLDLNETIFNVNPISPTHFEYKPLSYVEILNVWCLSIKINLPFLVFVREVTYRLNHKLINKVRNETVAPQVMDRNLWIKRLKRAKEFDKLEVFGRLSYVLKCCLEANKEMESVLNPLFEVFRMDLVETPTETLRVPGTYRRCANKYRYVRHLCAENEANNDPRFDLQLEETAAPSYQFYVGKMTFNPSEKPPKEIGEWMKVECMFCKIRFTMDVNLREALQSHYHELHQDEPDWKCTNCSKTFNLEFLAKNKWKHNC